MNLKELQQQPIYWKVIDSTYFPCKETREMIGGIYDQHAYFDYDNTVILWNNDKSDYWSFNLSDLQKMTPPEITFRKERIGIGDEVNWCRDWYEVYDYCWDDGVWKINCAKNKDYNNTRIFKETEIEDHKPLHPQTKETIEIGGQLYSKEEVENKLKDLKPIK